MALVAAQASVPAIATADAIAERPQSAAKSARAPRSGRNSRTRDSENQGTFLTQDLGDDTYRGSSTSRSYQTHQYQLQVRDDTSQSTRLHAKEQERKEVEKRLAEKKVLYEKKMKEFGRREEEFRKKQQEMVDSIRRFKAFVIETDAKRQRALSRAKQERMLREELEIKIRQAETEMRQHYADLEATRGAYEKLMPYVDYLEMVATRASPEEYRWTDVEALLARHQQLKEVNNDLMQRREAREAEMAHVQNALQELKKRSDNKILVMSSSQSIKQQQLEQHRNTAISSEHRAERAEEKSKDIRSRLDQLRQSIRNLYERARHREPDVKPGGGIMGPLTDKSVFFKAHRRKAGTKVKKSGTDTDTRDSYERALAFISFRLIELSQITADVSNSGMVTSDTHRDGSKSRASREKKDDRDKVTVAAAAAAAALGGH